MIGSTFERTVIKTLKMDINQKFQLTQFHFDSQGGFLTKSTFETIIKKLISLNSEIVASIKKVCKIEQYTGCMHRRKTTFCN